MSGSRTDLEILRARARELSKTLANPGENSDQQLAMVGFYMAPEHYCIESSFLKEVLSLKELTFIPGVPAFIQGIINLRGQVMSLMNLRKFLDLKETGISEQNKVMVVSHKGLEIGILVDRISGMFTVGGSEIDQALINFGGQGAEFIKGVTREGVIVLDCAALLESKKILIQGKP
ncbi:MAG: chemotaxis protein CheW [Bacteroidetes bacterium]|nr:chemotaxis protein CheW [Bacteroidota bacterium]